MLLDNLTGPARDLADCMNTISEDLFSAGWLHDLEWYLWQDLMAWRMDVPPVNLRADEAARWMPLLDEYQKAAGGWVWWLDGAQFVPDERWRELCLARASTGLFPPGNKMVAFLTGRPA